MKNNISIFAVYLIITFLLISTFMTMVTEANIIRVPEFPCPKGQRRDSRGKCRVVMQ
uniref:Venom peptide ECTX1-Rm62a n=1 Tax=Rhytidoponera metallica TaxID=148364 RepID=A0A8U0LTN0_RHYMT|nr:venom peptide precursor ECTX1-Rm62a [Rhytidoponera metallica]